MLTALITCTVILLGAVVHHWWIRHSEAIQEEARWQRIEAMRRKRIRLQNKTRSILAPLDEALAILTRSAVLTKKRTEERLEATLFITGD